jgi:hypothetical protein
VSVPPVPAKHVADKAIHETTDIPNLRVEILEEAAQVVME